MWQMLISKQLPDLRNNHKQIEFRCVQMASSCKKEGVFITRKNTEVFYDSRKDAAISTE